MKNFLVADRYARSLDGLAEDGPGAEALSAALNDLADSYAGSPALQSVLANPAILESARLAVLDELAGRCGAPDLVRQLAATMMRRRRIDLLPAVARLFSAKADARMNRVGATVTSAAPLTEAQSRQITAALESYTGKNVRVEYAVDPALLGGLTARIQDLVLDGSVRSRINRLKQFLLPEEKLGE